MKKTYTKTVEMPRLVIKYDIDAKSPRENENIGIFLTEESRNKSPDGNLHTLYSIMIETQDEATDAAHHMRLIKERAQVEFKKSAPKNGNSHDEDLHIIEIHPVYSYEHSSVSSKRGTVQGFDYSYYGFYFITEQSIAGGTYTAESIAKAIDTELKEYTQWCNGEVYSFILYDENGEIEESCGGFYDIEDIREYLPKEWSKEELLVTSK